MLIAFGVLMAVWFAVALVMDNRMARGGRVPGRVAAAVLPGRLPSYVRLDAEYARQARAQRRTGRPRG